MGLLNQSILVKISSSLTLLILISACSQLVAGEYGCPHQCLCYVDDSGFRTANCTGVEFMSAHAYQYSKIFSDIEVLNIRPHFQKPIKLKDDMFIHFVKLKYLNLSNCRIKTITKNVFNGLKKIWEINLSDNEIQHFHSSVFENMNDLNKLSLRGNPLQMTHKPYIISHSLKELDLGECGISALPNEFFHGLKRLTHLLLDVNFIRNIKDHVLPRGLVDLNLAHNRIVNIPIDTLLSLTQLRRLDLNENYINCTCVFLHLQDMLSGNGVLIDGNVVCAYPIELRNTSLNKVNENEACRREIYKDKQHRKSSNSKYIHQKENFDFENDKYSSYENFQRDQPYDHEYYPDQIDDATSEDATYKSDPEPLKTRDNFKKSGASSIESKVKHQSDLASVGDDLNDKMLSDSENVENQTDEQTDNEEIPHITGSEATVSDVDTYMKASTYSPDDSSNLKTNNKNRENSIDDELEDGNRHIEGDGHSNETITSDDVEQLKMINEDEKSSRIQDHNNLDSFEGSGVEDANEEEKITSLGEGIQFGLDDGNEDDATEFMLIKETKPSKPSDDRAQNEILETNQLLNGERSLEESNEKINFGEMGPYIVVGLIVLLVIVLILVSLVKACTKKNTKRDKISNMENANGTELQDITTLLPKPQEKEEKNSKYPDVTSPETVKLINGDKPHDFSEPTDMNQNDNRSEIVKNGVKPSPESFGPIEVTKAKLTILPDSIPRTPIFVQKNNAEIKKGVS